MRHTIVTRIVTVLGAAVACAALLPTASDACTRCVYLGPKDTVIVARSMDWAEDPGTNLYCFPRGMKRDGAAGPNSIAWTSAYGSVICAFYDVGSVDGMNEKGLVSNILFLVESDYGKPDGTQSTLSITAWAQYVLDNFATVAEAVDALRREPFVIIAPILPTGAHAQGHMAISDPSGDSAIFEYVKGTLVIHHGREYQVMTNSPTFDQQLALNKYWEQIGGLTFLPGTNRAADRFARASFYINAIPKTDEHKRAVASVFSVIRGVSVPLGITTPGQPNISSTIWRTVYDHKNKVLYFDSATSPTVFRVPLADLDFKGGAPVKKLTLSGGETYSGSAAAMFKNAEPFKFLSAEAQ
ncbi:MAG: linear amide C-N hydrolase [Chlamydiota bacterium]